MMESNSFTSKLFEDVKTLRSLGAGVDVDLNGNPISVRWGLHAPITDDGLEILHNLSSITELELHGTMTDERLKHVGLMSQLTSLFLGRRYLHVQPNTFTDAGMAYLSGLTNLHTLSLASFGTISTAGVAHLKGLTNLRSLDLSFKISLDTLRQLKHLKLAHLTVPDSIGLKYVPFFPRLETVYASETTDEEAKLLAGLRRIKELGIVSQELTDKAIEYILPLKTLKILYLFDTRISTDGFAKLRAGLPNCEIQS